MERPIAYHLRGTIMRMTPLLWSSCFFFMLAVGSIALRADDDDEAKQLKIAIAAAKKSVLDYTDKLDKKTKSPNDLATDAAPLAKQHKIEPAMKLFKPKSTGGIGTGGLAAGSIELLIRDYTTKKPLAPGVVAAFRADLMQVGHVTLVMSELLPHYAPKKDVGPKTAAEWLKLSKEMKQGSLDFLDAVRANNNVQVAATAARMNTACAGCHKLFRDDK